MGTFKKNKDLNDFLHPYLFVLKKGEKEEDLMDYSLNMLQLSQVEVYRTPKWWKLFPFHNITENR